MSSIEVKGISKKFGSVEANKNISLNFEHGKIYGLLGRNGAGKSTLLNIISNRIFADSGEVLVDGETVIENDQALGKMFLMSEGNLYPESMKVKSALRWSNEFYDDFDTECFMAIATQFGLITNQKIKSLSTGYKSIFKIATAMSTNAPYILLDEPILGLDAGHRDMFYKLLIKRYEETGSCYVISTHLIEEASRIIEDVAIIDSGSLIINDTCENLLRQGFTVTGKASEVDRFIQDKNVIGTDSLGGLKTAYILEKLDRETVSDDIEISKLDLQRLFIELTNSKKNPGERMGL